MRIRTLFKADIAQLVRIEQTAHVLPWSEETFQLCTGDGYYGWVIEQDKQVLGFIIVSMRVEDCHILNLCVARAHQHQGLGRRLLQHVLQQAKDHGIRIVYLEVRRTNTRAIALYQKEAFEQIGERKGYYPTQGGDEDALVFVKSLS